MSGRKILFSFFFFLRASHSIPLKPQTHSSSQKMATQSLTLQPSGHKMPLLGFGTWKVPKDTTADVVLKVIIFDYQTKALSAAACPTKSPYAVL